MSKQFLLKLNGSKDGLFKNFLDSVGENPRIAWYPSAHNDFAPLFYLQTEYLTANPTTTADPTPPDLYLFSDYFPYPELVFLKKEQHNIELPDMFEVTNYEELPSVNLPLHKEIVLTPFHPNHNRVFFLTVRVKNNLVDKEYPVLYVIAENEAFCAEMLIPSKVKLSHIIHVRYGGGMGGGGFATGFWMQNILKKLSCEVFITDNSYATQDGDLAAMRIYPVLGEEDRPEMESIRIIKRENWSNYGDIDWMLIKNGKG